MCYRRVCGSTPGDWDANNPVLALSLRRCRTTAHTSSAAPRFPTMLLSPRPFGSRLGGRLGVINPELRPPLVAIPSVRDTAHTFEVSGSPVPILRKVTAIGITPTCYSSLQGIQCTFSVIRLSRSPGCHASVRIVVRSDDFSKSTHADGAPTPCGPSPCPPHYRKAVRVLCPLRHRIPRGT